MTVRLTRAEAELLGVLRNAKAQPAPPPAPRKRRRRTAPGPYHTVCVYCAAIFTTAASEDRHVEDTRHGRYQLILEAAAP